MTALTHAGAAPAAQQLSMARLHVMRGAYLVIAVGLAVVKWPLIPTASSLPLFEGVTLAMLVALSLLALLGVRYPVRMLPVLLFESAWKLLWLGLVALPKAIAGTLDAAATQILVNCSVVVVVLAAIPWTDVWRRFVREAGDRWS
jgi:hypothetical protein